MNASTGDVTLVGALQPDVTLTYVLLVQANDTVQTTNFNVTAQVKTGIFINYKTCFKTKINLINEKVVINK